MYLMLSKKQWKYWRSLYWKNNLTTYIKTEGLLKSIQEIEQIRISSSNAKFPIFIRDVSKVSFGSLPRFGALTFDDQGEAVGGIVLMLKGANSSEVIKSVKERMEQIKRRYRKESKLMFIWIELIWWIVLYRPSLPISLKVHWL